MSSHENSIFLTLTYSDEHLPPDGSLKKNEFQKFMKRMRKALGDRRIKYYACGEYGEENGRPHYHAILFNMSRDDHELIHESWNKGLIDIGTVTYDSCRYVADYVMKSYDGDLAKEVYGDREVPWRLSSLGLGKKFAIKNAEYFKQKLGCTVRGQEVGLPKYYQKVLDIDTELLKARAEEHNLALQECAEKKYPDKPFEGELDTEFEFARNYLRSSGVAEKEASSRRQKERNLLARTARKKKKI